MMGSSKLSSGSVSDGVDPCCLAAAAVRLWCFCALREWQPRASYEHKVVTWGCGHKAKKPEVPSELNSLLLALLGLCPCQCFSLVAPSRGYSLAAVREFLAAVASLVVERGL